MWSVMYVGSTWEQRSCLNVFEHVVCHLAYHFSPNKGVWNGFIEQIPVLINWFRQKEINSSWHCPVFFLSSLHLGDCSYVMGREMDFSSETLIPFCCSQLSHWPDLLPWACSLSTYSCSVLSHKVLPCFGAVFHCFRVSLRHIILVSEH